ncbi:MAG: NAD(P)H-quinone oxidoreductase [Rubellimicrobium sp.]|nr:NAD(P)H-quinone oxidoreductase [Rubellimicrobium sp.]
MAEMQVVEITAPGGPEVLRMAARPVPEPGPGEVLIRVAFAGVNRPDAAQRAGLYPPPPGASDLPGLEASGEIAALGAGVTGWAPGDAVCALLPGGGYAQYAVTAASHCLPVPEGMGLDAAACLPETFFTVWSNVFMRGGLQAGERLLVHGGSSGIGSTAIQLGRTFGARVFATAGTAEKCAFCRELGAEAAWNYRADDWSAAMRAAGGADVVLDMVGGDYLAHNLAALTMDGRIVQIATLGGAEAQVNLARLMMRRATLTGSTLRPQSVLAKARIAAELRDRVWPLLARGRLWPVLDSTFALADAAGAHRRLESSQHMGKIVLRVQ